MILAGCLPAPEEVSALFTLGVTAGSNAAGFMVPATASADPHTFSFLGPSAPLGALFNVDVNIDSPSCPPDADPPPETWVSGAPFVVVILPGTSDLWASDRGSLPPIDAKKEFPVGAWVTFVDYPGSPAGVSQLFRWTTDVAAATSGELQVSVLPFPSDPLSEITLPPGVVFTKQVNCVNCDFLVNLSELFPKNLLFQGSPVQNLMAQVGVFLKTSWNAVKLSVLTLWGKVSGTPVHLAQAKLQLPSGEKPSDTMTAGQGAPLMISDYYFRVIPEAKDPLLGDQVAGAATNTVHVRFFAEETLIDMPPFPNCTQTPIPTGCPTAPPPGPKPYIVEIISYHGIIPPVAGHVDCYISTKKQTIVFGAIQTTYPQNSHFCPPEPKKPAWYEVLVNLIVDGLNWVSQAYNEMKAAVVEAMAQFVPSAVCSKSCLDTVLQGALASMGIPPSIPNFDQLMNQGMDYLADQAIAQLPIPPEVTSGLTGELLNQAIGDWQAEMKDGFKGAMQEGMEAAKYALSQAVSYVPDGVPVVADPEGSVQPATVVLRITRDPNVPEAPGTCSMSSDPTQANLVLLAAVKQDTVTADMQTFNDHHNGPGPGQGPDLAPGEWQHLFNPESVVLPSLAPGQSMTVPVLLAPIMTWGAGHGFIHMSAQIEAWNAMYKGGQASLTVPNSPCVVGDSLKVSADGAWSE